MSRYANAGSVQATSGGKRPPLPEGDYPALMIERCREADGTDPAKRGAHYYFADLEVLEDTPQCPKGTGGTFVVQDGGNKYKDHDDRGVGQIKDFLGVAAGLATMGERTRAIGGAEIEASYVNGGLALAGYVVAAKVTHTKAKASGETICNYQFRPVIDPATGKTKVVVREAAAPAPAAAPAAPPPAAVPAGPPPGWAKHPDPAWGAQGWFYNQANPTETRQFPGA